MAKRIDQPCKDGLSAACFAQEPNFAKRAFSFRLLNAFVPPKLSRRLLTFLGLIRFDPAGNLPEWINLPPWWIILPGTIIPPGWKFGDPIFDGVYEIPNFFQGREWENPYGPDYLKPGGSGSPGKSKTTPSLFDPWFYDDFSEFDQSYWEKSEDTGTTVTFSTGQVRFQVPADPGTWTGIISKNVDDTVPLRFILTFNIAFNSWGSGDDYFAIRLKTGIRYFRINFVPPNTIWHGDAGGTVIVDNLTSTFETWKIVYDNGFSDLYREGVLLHEGQSHLFSGSNAGKFDIYAIGQLDCVMKLLSVVEY